MTDPKDFSQAPAATVFPDVPGAKVPESWHEALLHLLVARFSLIRIEAGEAAGHAGRRLAAGLAAAVLGLFFWALLMAGLIGMVASLAGWGWYWVTLVAAGLHGVGIVILLMVARKTAPTAFPVTRAELEKDREWIETLKRQNSND